MWSVNVAQQGWVPLVSESQEIEQSFQRGEYMSTITNTATGETTYYMFQSMLEIGSSEQRQLLRSANLSSLPSSFTPWRFESDPRASPSTPKEFRQMSPHNTELLTMMRKRGDKQGMIHDYMTFVTYEFDLVAMTQINKMTNTMRYIIPAPGEAPSTTVNISDDAVVPNEYKCPISHELMVDPIVASDGHTYERFCFERWVSGGKIVSPMTNAPLYSINTIPNLNLKKIISQFISENGAEDDGKKTKKRKRKQSAAENALEAVIAMNLLEP